MSNPNDSRQVENEKEKELIARAQQGDRAAFAALVRAHQNGVYTLARRLVGDPHLASDVTQEALIRAWRAVHTRSIEEGIPLRLAAYVEALRKVEEATLQRY